MKNAKFFAEHADQSNPCYAHVCYPSEEPPYYTWVSRFQSEKCCKHHDHVLAFDQEIILSEDDDCRSQVLKCIYTDDGGLMSAIEVNFRIFL